MQPKRKFMQKLHPFLKDVFIYRLSEISILEVRKIHKFDCGVYGI